MLVVLLRQQLYCLDHRSYIVTVLISQLLSIISQHYICFLIEIISQTICPFREMIVICSQNQKRNHEGLLTSGRHLRSLELWLHGRSVEIIIFDRDDLIPSIEKWRSRDLDNKGVNIFNKQEEVLLAPSKTSLAIWQFQILQKVQGMHIFTAQRI